MKEAIFNFFNEDCIDICEEWFNEEDIKGIELRILILTGVLADNNLAYRGTLKDMCEWLCLSSNSVNNKKIKAAIQNLIDKEYLYCNIDGRTFTLSISNKALKDRNIIKIKRVWIETIKNYNRDENNNKIDKTKYIDWINILKVFIFLYSRDSGKPNIITLDSIADELNIQRETIRKAVNAIQECNLQGIGLSKEIVKDKIDFDDMSLWRTQGTVFQFYIKFDDM